MEKFKKFALIVAGGSGNRMKNSVPKQFISVNGKPILMHTLEVFHRYDAEMEIVLVLPENQVEIWNELCNEHRFQLKHYIAFGGETRFHSVKNGLAKINEAGVVFIHDGVRPLVSLQTLENCFQTAVEKGNALPVVPATESIRYVDKTKSVAVDRSKHFLVQTPQTFRVDEVKAAYEQEFSTFFTDDASVLEQAGGHIHTVEGNIENIKITFPHDLKVAALLLNE